MTVFMLLASGRNSPQHDFISSLGPLHLKCQADCCGQYWPQQEALQFPITYGKKALISAS